MTTLTLHEKERKLVLKFPYEDVLVTKAKSIPTGKWNQIQKQWEFECTAGVYKLLKEKFGVSIKELERTHKIDLSKYKYKTEPRKHQREGVRFILEQLGFEVKEEKP